MVSVVQQPSDRTFAVGEHPYIISAQQNFADQYAHEQPSQAISAYARYILEHTKAQLENATTTARRHSSGEERRIPGNLPTIPSGYSTLCEQ